MLRRLDIFGSRRFLSFDGQYTFRTILGFILSVATAVLSFLAFFYYLVNFLQRHSEPTVAVERLQRNLAPSQDLSRLKFLLTFSAIYENSYLTTEEFVKIMDVKVEQVEPR